MKKEPATVAAVAKTPRGERTRRRILKSAEEAFGRLGFHGAGIVDITRGAGIAQGTFYCHFPSKEATLRELVRQLGRDLRRFVAERVAGSSDRLEAEERGLRAFLDFVAANKNLYRILQEALFVDESIYREYYETFGTAYERLLRQAEVRGEIAPGDSRVRAWALMGMGHFLGMRYALWQRDIPFDEVVATAADLMRNGLAAGGER
ncbi:MAG TPA: TetR/AcrR family transcriptional regulator [Gammaproteobacteria bacterium]|nr:TetR/AcrR family transcriptional regulator [Gammaproteobacteria bacterium]